MNLATRVTLIEHAISKLADRRGPRLSNELREARARVLAGEAPAPALHDITTLEAAARGRGIAADMAKAQLRMLRGFAPDALLPVRGAAQDGRSEAEGYLDASRPATRSVAPAPAATGPSVSELTNRIDQLVGRYG